MSIEFRCTQCDQLLRVPDDSAGKSARCPKCQALMTVPAQSPGEFPVQPPPPPFTSPTPVNKEGLDADLKAKDNVFADQTGASPFGGPPSASLNPYASPSAAAYAYPPNMPGFAPRPGLPWETKGYSFATWWETTKLCLMQPSYGFAIMRQYGGMGQPMLFAGVGLTLGTAGQMLWYIPLIVGFSLLGAQGRAGGGEVAAMAGIQIVTQLITGVFTVVIGATLGLMIGAAIGHVCLMVLGGARQGYETTLRVIGYTQGATAWMNVIPGGGLVAFVWMIVMEIIGFSKAHEIDTGKAALAVFLPMIICCGCMIIIIAAIFGTAAFADWN